VLCADISHIYNDESSAPETVTGCRYVSLPTNEQGKLEPSAIEKKLIRKGDIHYAQTKLLSVTQSTEYGTVYSIDELRTMGELVKPHGLYYHMDGSRLFNAAASLGCSLKDITWGAGLDIVSLGGTKAGMMFGEAVLVFNKDLSQHIAYKHKQCMQLASKNRFIAAQFEAMLTNELWRKNATHCNNMAQYLYKAISRFPQIRVTKPVQANVVFAELPLAWIAPLQQQFPFYIWKSSPNEARLMCSFDTTTADIDAFEEVMRRL
jgi:threonine aldolase